MLGRLLNVAGIVFLIYGFCANCLFLYVGTFLCIFSEINIWFLAFKYALTKRCHDDR